MKKVNEKGFTLAELLIVVAVIAVLVAVAIPTFADQLEKSRQAVDVSNLRGAYAAAKLAAMDGKIDGVAIDGKKVYYYDPSTGSLTDSDDDDLTKTAYGKATGSKVFADISNLSGEIVYDVKHLATNDRCILVSYNVANTVASIKLISFEKTDATANTLEEWEDAETSGTIKSIDGAFNYPTIKNSSGGDITLDMNATVVVTTDKGKYSATLTNLGTTAKVKVEDKDAATMSASVVIGKNESTTADSDPYAVTIIGTNTGDNPVTGSAMFSVVIPKKTT